MKRKFILYLIVLFISSTAMSMNPIKEHVNAPDSFGAPYISRNIKTSDRANIEVWKIPAVEGSEIKNISLVMSFSDGANMSYWSLYGVFFAAMGFDVYMYDYRGFGKSEPELLIDTSYLYYAEFVTDLEAVVDYVKSSDSNKICLMGLSMGSIVIMNYLSNPKNAVDYYIGDGHVYSPQLAVQRIKEADNKVLKLPEHALDYTDIYANINIPVLLIQAQNDRVCTNEDMNVLKEKLSNLTVFECDSAHLQCFFSSPETRNAYINEVVAFLSNKNTTDRLK